MFCHSQATIYIVNINENTGAAPPPSENYFVASDSVEISMSRYTQCVIIITGYTVYVHRIKCADSLISINSNPFRPLIVSL